MKLRIPTLWSKRRRQYEHFDQEACRPLRNAPGAGGHHPWYDYAVVVYQVIERHGNGTASLAPDYVRRNFEQLFAAGIHLEGTYLDVFTCNELDECVNPHHPMTRRECIPILVMHAEHIPKLLHGVRELLQALPPAGLFAGGQIIRVLVVVSGLPPAVPVTVNHPAGGPTRIFLRHLPSMGKMDYARTVSYCFVPAGSDYVTLCKLYREIADEEGRPRTLKEKAAQNPNVEKLIGCCVMHVEGKSHVTEGSAYYDKENPEKNDRLVPFSHWTERVKRLKGLGVDQLYLHLDGWGQPGYDNQHPDYLPPCKEAGGGEGPHIVRRKGRAEVVLGPSGPSCQGEQGTVRAHGRTTGLWARRYSATGRPT